ncbi:MAG: hypothetical protein V6Z89_12700 [Desulfobacter sp.]
MQTETDLLRVVLYCRGNTETEHKLLETVRNVVPGDRISHYQDMAGISQTLATPGSKILVIVIQDSGELDAFVRIREQLQDRAIILILPDDGPEIMHRSLALYPKYISNSRTQFTDVGLVLEKIIQHRKYGGE